MSEWWYCSCEHFQHFTYGKMYECVENKGSYLLLINDLGQVSSPSIITHKFGEYIVNFMTPHQWSEHRTKKINQILGLMINDGIS